MIKWLFQTSGFRNDTLHPQISAAQRLGFNIQDFGVIRDSDSFDITNLECVLENIDDTYVIRGGIKLLSILDSVKQPAKLNQFLSPSQIAQFEAHSKKLREGLFYDVNAFDQALYRNFGLPLLNADAQYIQAHDAIDLTFKSDVFIKPSRDLKAFNAGILPAGCSFKEYLNQTWRTEYAMDETLIIAPLKDIVAEYRFFVVADIISTGSIYKIGRDIKWCIIPDTDQIWNVAETYSKLYKPHDIFTMDLALMSDGSYKIVEYNCWNASGLYSANIEKLFGDVNSFVKVRSIPYVEYSL